MLFNYGFKNAFRMSDKEATMILIISVLSGFILSFRRWGTEGFNVNEGFSNLISFTLSFLILFLVFIFSQKFIAYSMGLRPEFFVWKYGPPLGVLITFMTFGLVPFVFVGGLKFEEIPRLRVGRFRKTVINVQEMLGIGLSGPLVLVFLSLLVFFPLYNLTGLVFFFDLVWISSLILVVSCLPLPSLNGMNILLRFKGVWLVFFLYSLTLFVLLNLLQHVLAYVLALIIALFAAWLVSRFLKSY